MNAKPLVISPEIPIEWFLDTMIIRHEAAAMGLMPPYYVNLHTFTTHIYNHTAMHLEAMMKEEKNPKGTASMRVLLGSLVKREFLFWDPDELEIFKNKVSNQIEKIRQMDKSGEISFDKDPVDAIRKAQEQDPEIVEIAEIWENVFIKAFDQCKEIIRVKNAQTHDCGIWQIIQDHAYRRN